MSKHNDLVYLRHILEATDKVDQLVNRGGRSLFDEDFAISDAVVRELMVIGEAARSLSDNFKQSNFQIPWKDIVGMRDWLVHGYAEIDWDRVWNTATNNVPQLKKHIEVILKNASPAMLN